MTNIFIAYDTRSGRIMGVHNGPADPNYVWDHKYGAHENVAVMKMPSYGRAHGKKYKIDVSRKALVECASDEQGVSFGFGRTGRMPSGTEERTQPRFGPEESPAS